MASTTNVLRIGFTLLCVIDVETIRVKRKKIVQRDSNGHGYGTAWLDSNDDDDSNPYFHTHEEEFDQIIGEKENKCEAECKDDGLDDLDDSKHEACMDSCMGENRQPDGDHATTIAKMAETKLHECKKQCLGRAAITEVSEEMCMQECLGAKLDGPPRYTLREDLSRTSGWIQTRSRIKPFRRLKEKFNEAKGKLVDKIKHHTKKLGSSIKKHITHVAKAISEKAKPLLSKGADALLKCAASAVGVAVGNPAAVVSCIREQATMLKEDALKLGGDVHAQVKSSYDNFTKELATDTGKEISAMITLQNKYRAKVADGEMNIADALSGVVKESVDDVVKENIQIAAEVSEIRRAIDTLADKKIER